VSLALAAAVVAYAVLAGDRLPEVVLGVGALGCALLALAFVANQPALFPVGVAGVGAAYAVFLSLRSGALDARAPAVAALLFVAAELGFSALERTPSYAEPAVLGRQLGLLAAAAILAGLVGSLVLALTAGVAGSVALEAAGVAAATLTVAAVAVLAARSSV